jgi:hypothetical protein
VLPLDGLAGVGCAAVPLAPLPIDDVLPALIAAVRDRGAAVLVAPPGAGKTTRVPGALLDAGLAGAGDVVVLEPRRLATRLAANRVAFERGARIGDEVGYEVRFDRKVGAATRIRFVTEGVLTRRLLADPELRGTGAVVLDELHERHLAGDLALALLERLRRTRRPDLKLVAMSATLDPGPIAAFLDAPVVVSEGRAFPVDVEYLPMPDDRLLGKQLAAAIRRLCQRASTATSWCSCPAPARSAAPPTTSPRWRRTRRHVLPLHGDLPSRRAGPRDRAGAAAQDHPRHQRRRDLGDDRRRRRGDRQRPGRGSRATTPWSGHAQPWSSSRSARPARSSARVAPAAPAPAAACASTPATTSTPGAPARRRRSCAPIWPRPRSSCTPPGSRG